MRQRLLLLLLLLPLLAAAQPTPPPQGYRLHRVHRLRPMPLPPGGLVPYYGDYFWTWSDTLGRPFVRVELDNMPHPLPGPYQQTERGNLARYARRSDRWQAIHGEEEVWINAKGQYLRTPADRMAVRQPDGSLRSVAYRRHLTAPVYHFEVGVDGEDPAQRFWRNHHNGWVYYLGSGLYAVRGPSARRHYRQTYRHPVHSDLGPPYAVIDSTGRRLTPYCYERLLPMSDGRIRVQWQRPDGQQWIGYLDRRGRWVLGPYTYARPFRYGRAVVQFGQGAEERHALIDTAGRYIIAPTTAFLTNPDAAGLVRYSAQAGHYRYLDLNGQLAIPGWFAGAEDFVGDSALVRDSLGRAGVVYRDGTLRLRPRPEVAPINQRAPAAAVVPADSGRVRLVDAAGRAVGRQTFAWAQVLAGGWFAVRSNTAAPLQLLTPAGKPVALPAGKQPDIEYHGLFAAVPFANGLLKVLWGKPAQEGGYPPHTAFMTRGGRILSSDQSPE